MNPAMTIFVTEDAEKEPLYLQRYFRCLEWFHACARPYVQVVVLCQTESPDYAQHLLDTSGWDGFVVQLAHPRPGGYPLWDVCAEAAAAWPQVKGEYITFNHSEFMHYPGRLWSAIQCLRAKKPTIALGNLRRYNAPEKHVGAQREFSKAHSALVASAIDGGDPLLAADWMNGMVTRCWIYWGPEPEPGPSDYREDVFFARKDWCDAMHFWDHADRMVFQDVYDLIRAAIEEASKWGLTPDCIRMTRAEHEAHHLWHSRLWKCWQPAVKEWFFSQGAAWTDTRFRSTENWNRCLAEAEAGWTGSNRAVQDMRRGPASTVARFRSNIGDWFQSGGADAVRQYIEARRR